MLLSDRDIRAEIAAGRVRLDPYDETLLQPSSVDLRLDRHFRTFVNHRYTHIDPALQQDDLTRPVTAPGDEPFVLHPGEFVLGSSYEVITLPDDVAGRLEGKALALDTPIPTPAGWRLLGELTVGDQVFDEQGRPTLVTAVTGVLRGRPCFEVAFSDGAVLVADALHQWMTSTKLDRKRGRAPRIRTTIEIGESLRYHDETNHQVEMAGPVQYPSQELPIDPYVLGVWLGDGTTAAATVATAESQVLDEIHRIGAEGQLRDPATGRYGDNGSLQATLRREGLLGHQHVPQCYLLGSVSQRIALLQGLMDAGGYGDVTGRCEFVSIIEHLADAVVELAASLGLRPVKRKKRAVWRGVDCEPAYQVTFRSHLPVFRLERKLARFTGIGLSIGRFHRHSGIAHSGIVAVTPTPSRPMCCIQVDSPRGMFLAGRSFIPTHNSSLGRLGLLTHSTAGFIDPGFSGHVTLELSNVANLPIMLWPGMKVGQLCLFRLSSPAEHPYGSPVYGSRYQDQRGPTPSRSFHNFRRGLD